MTGGLRRAAAAAAALLLAAAAARADVTLTTSFGFDGSVVGGTISPVRIELASSDKAPVRCRVTVFTKQGIGSASGRGIVRVAEVFLGPEARKRVTVPILAEAYSYSEWFVEVTTDRKTLLRHGVEYKEGKQATFSLGQPGGRTRGSIDPTAAVVGVLGDPTLRCDWLGDTSRYGVAARGAVQSELVTRLTWGSLRLNPPGAPPAAIPEFLNVTPLGAPDTWLCYEGLDALLWVDPDPESLPDASQATAVLDYAANGGLLLVALTPGSKLAAASALARALPALATGHDDVPAAEVAQALVKGTMKAGAPVPVARLGPIRGTVQARLPDGRPLLVTVSHGLGTVGVLTFDPRLLSGVGATQHAALLRLLFGPVVHAEPSETESGLGSQSLDPLMHHLRKRFLSPPSFTALLLGLLVYVLAIGPVDYFLLKRKKKLRRTVVTFPLIVGGFTVLAWGSSFLLFGASSGQVRVAWIDLATSPGRDADVVRGTDVLGTYTPVGTTLRLSFDQPRSFPGPPWFAGGNFSMMGGSVGTLDGVVAQGPDGRPEAAFELPLRSQRTVQTRFSGEVPSSLDASIRRGPDGGRTLEIRNGFRIRVRDLVIVEGNRAAFAGDLDAGGKAALAMAGIPWTTVGSDARLPDPFVGEGFFQGSHAPWGEGGTQFVPADGTPGESANARDRIARALQGASVGGLFTPGAWIGGRTRMLHRHGLDLTPAVRAGRVLVMGWCESDPLGTLPAGKSVVSTAVVVRRLLPAAEEEAR